MYLNPKPSRSSLGTYNYSLEPHTSVKPLPNSRKRPPSPTPINPSPLKSYISPSKPIHNPQLENNTTQTLKLQLFNKREMTKFYKKECQRRRDRFEEDWRERESVLVNTINNLVRLIEVEGRKGERVQEEIRVWEDIIKNEKKIMKDRDKVSDNRKDGQETDQGFDDSLMATEVSKQIQESMLI